MIVSFSCFKMAVDTDIVAMTSNYLHELLPERISTEEKSALENWFSIQVFNERQGWTKKLQMSMKEIELERRMALEIHHSIQELVNKLEPYKTAYEPLLLREPSMYCGAEKDLKLSQLGQLEKTVECIIEALSRFHEERMKCGSALLCQCTSHTCYNNTPGPRSTFFGVAPMA